ncbi:hypothetical protein N1851_001749 [Merluccius polli]|uniref:Uncharacterized protein n=1 Tax=Merluccius polli TaxID=89951 RepID=A0AA47NCQ2_MERPO|nr:hypothetical protein N1851_001749 [Merluccius polli]
MIPHPGQAMGMKGQYYSAQCRHSDGISKQRLAFASLIVLFVCHGGHRRGHALSKQRLSNWIVEAISEAYKAKGLPVPFNVKCTRSVSTSWNGIEGCIPRGHKCGGDLGICQVLKGQCRCPPRCGGSCPA